MRGESGGATHQTDSATAPNHLLRLNLHRFGDRLEGSTIPTMIDLQRHPILSTPGNGRPDESARARIHRAADALFYLNGIHATGLDDIAAAAGVSRRTLSRSTTGKEALAVDYIRGRHDRDVSVYESLRSSGLPAQQILETVLGEIEADLDSPGFRGCPFINAAAEYSDPRAAVRVAVREHREWYVQATATVLRDAGHPMPGDAADDVLLVRDGAMSSSYSGDRTSATMALRRAVDRTLSEIPTTGDVIHTV
jgi:AcrR family transcriptional regulator